MTVIWWLLISYFGYWNTNFDMLSTMENYIMYLNLTCIAVGMISNGKRCEHLVRLGVLNTILVVFALSFSKSTLTDIFGYILLVPMSMFCFFLLLKNILIVISQK